MAISRPCGSDIPGLSVRVEHVVLAIHKSIRALETSGKASLSSVILTYFTEFANFFSMTVDHFGQLFLLLNDSEGDSPKSLYYHE